MRREPNGDIVLSKRNIVSLLNKVNDPHSFRTLIGGSDAEGVVVIAEPDEEHYRRPGRLSKEPGPVASQHDPGPPEISDLYDNEGRDCLG